MAQDKPSRYEQREADPEKEKMDNNLLMYKQRLFNLNLPALVPKVKEVNQSALKPGTYAQEARNPRELWELWHTWPIVTV